METNTVCPDCHKKRFVKRLSNGILELCCDECHAKRQEKLKGLTELKGGNESPVDLPFTSKREKPIVRGKKGQVWWQMLKGRGGK